MDSGLKYRLAALQNADFLTRSSFGISLIAFFIMLPFGINNLLQDRFIGAVSALVVAALFASNALITSCGKYPLYLNFFGVVPALSIASITALISLQVIGSYWPFLCVFGIYYTLPFKYARYANLAYVLLVLAVAWTNLEQAIAIRFCTVLIGISLFIFVFSREIAKNQDAMRTQATTDSLTGLLNRVTLNESLTQATERFRLRGTPSTVCLLDIDHFKHINDNYGHDAGDKVLITLALRIADALGENDTLFRIGGEEFLILMNNTTSDAGLKTANTIRSLVQELPLLKDHVVTVSIGVSQVDASFDWKAWMKVSDEKLYLAKEKGRNQVVI